MACTTLEYVRREAVRTREGDVQVDVVGIEAPGGHVRYKLEVSGPEGIELRDAWIREEGSAECGGGERPIWIEVDGRRVTHDPPVAIGGKHVIELAFLPFRHAGAPLMIDLGLVGTQAAPCVRVPLGIPSKWQLANSVAVSAGLDLNIAPSGGVAGVVGVVGVPIGIGTWLGRVRLGLHTGIGFAACDDSVCALAEDGTRQIGLAVPLGASATWYPLIADAGSFNPRGQLALGVELRLREDLVWLPLDSGTELRVIHAPQAVLHVVATSGRAPHHLPAGPRMSSFDAELSIGAFIAEDERGPHTALLLGVGLTFYWWL